MIISLIAALADNKVIGNKNKIPWHIKGDFVHFKTMTLNHTIIMGRTTFESIMNHYNKEGRPLPKRRIVIVSRDKQYSVRFSECWVATSVEEALKIAVEKESLALATDAVNKANMMPEGEVFVCGGASIFEQTIGKADRLHLTLVHETFEGDTYFPDYSNFTKVIGKEDKKTPEGLAYTFLDLEK